MGNPDAIPAFTDNYIWYYRNPHGGSIVVDPGDAGPVLRAVQEGLSIEAVFITHHHHDHIGGLAELLQHADVPCYAPVDARIEGISHPVGHGDGIRIDGEAPWMLVCSCLLASIGLDVNSTAVIIGADASGMKGAERIA